MISKGRCKRYRHATYGCKACKRSGEYRCRNCEVSSMTDRKSCYSCIHRGECHDYPLNRNINA